MYCVILESLLLEIRIEHFNINEDATMIMDNPEWIVKDYEWESYRRTNIIHPTHANLSCCCNGAKLACLEGMIFESL